MKYVRSFQNIEGDFCDVLATADCNGYTVDLYAEGDYYVVDGVRQPKSRHYDLQDAIFVYKNIKTVRMARRFGTFETTLPIFED